MRAQTNFARGLVHYRKLVRWAFVLTVVGASVLLFVSTLGGVADHTKWMLLFFAHYPVG